MLNFTKNYFRGFPIVLPIEASWHVFLVAGEQPHWESQCVGVAQGAVRARLSAGEAIGDLVPKAVEGDAQAPRRDVLPQGRLPASAACTRPDPPSLLPPSCHRHPSTSSPPLGRLPLPVLSRACLVLTRPSCGARCSVVRRICWIPEVLKANTKKERLLISSSISRFLPRSTSISKCSVYPHTLGAKSKTHLTRAAFDFPIPEMRDFFPPLHIIPDQIACGPTGPPVRHRRCRPHRSSPHGPPPLSPAQDPMVATPSSPRGDSAVR